MSEIDEGEDGTQGGIRVANEVIASIAAMAACEVDGVAEMDEANARHFGDWLSRQSAHRGVRVRVDPERAIHLDRNRWDGATRPGSSPSRSSSSWRATPRTRPRPCATEPARRRPTPRSNASRRTSSRGWPSTRRSSTS